jgi:hypothetical protein
MEEQADPVVRVVIVLFHREAGQDPCRGKQKVIHGQNQWNKLKHDGLEHVDEGAVLLGAPRKALTKRTLRYSQLHVLFYHI